MTWKIRHEGSPQAIDGLTATQVIEGLQDGLWEPADQVMGPEDLDWVALENHPQFADLAAELEPQPARHHEDETRLDMNPLIDVCLVLLIFFILTTSYAYLQKVLDLPAASSQKLEGPPVVTKEQVKEFMIKVEARQENGLPVIRVEDEVVDPVDLVGALRRYVRENRKTEVLIDAAGVSWGTIVNIQDASKGAGVQRAHLLIQPDSTPQPGL
jgi:biopolymer transport protein ExbD